MKVLLLATRLNLGGIGIYTTMLAKLLSKRGINVYVASSGGELVGDLEKNKIEHIYLPIDTSAEIGPHMLISYYKLARFIRDNHIELIHAQTRVTQVLAEFLTRKRDIIFVSTCHGFFKKRFIRRFLPCWGDYTIAISDAVREHLVNDMKVVKEKVRVIYNGIDIRHFSKQYTQQDKTIIREEYGLRDNMTTIGIVARLSSVKGHKYLFSAFAQLIGKLKNLQLLVVGGGDESYLKLLKAQVKLLGIEDKVIFSGPCSDTSMPLAVIDLFCLPTLQEGMGLSILEAMAMGVPVVTSNVGGVYTLIKHKHNGYLVDPKDEHGLADAILFMLTEKESRDKMVEHSRAIARDKFSMDIMANNVIELYEEAIDMKKSKIKNQN
ncbi:glycosyltransferase family 4 protein [Candidatus Omnitrophota bacterium]